MEDKEIIEAQLDQLIDNAKKLKMTPYHMFLILFYRAIEIARLHSKGNKGYEFVRRELEDYINYSKKQEEIEGE